jgi:hypothetical protein
MRVLGKTCPFRVFIVFYIPEGTKGETMVKKI